ncbi:MAG: GDSL-type esterase/lipase family protein [Chitinophagaceae bacterium]
MKQVKILFLFLLVAKLLPAQENKPPFYNDIQAFKKQDSASFPPQNAILFIGSSSFTRWTDVQQYFPAYPIINRGFGGSTLPDQLRYMDDIVFPYRPRQIVVYCGENDLASSDTVTARRVYDRFRQLFNRIRSKWPRVHIVYVSMKPSPSRQLLLGRMREANELIRGFLKTKRRTGYVDVYKAMVDDEGKPVAGLFGNDNLHMNKDGYAIWQKLIQPYLLK